VTGQLVQPGLDVHPADNRFSTQLPWLDSHHSFSFGAHWDEANTHFGLLLVNNDNVLRPGTGFETHPYRDVEIVTWVVYCSLVQRDSQGHCSIVYPDLAQRVSAGTGTLHSETNDSWRTLGGPPHTIPVRFIQMWVVPDEKGFEPTMSKGTLGTHFFERISFLLPRAWMATGTMQRSESGSETPPCMPLVSTKGQAWCFPKRPSSTSSSPSVGLTSRVPDGLKKGMRFGLLRPPGRRLPRPDRPKFLFGKCTQK
jgi:hypothetical protein